MRTGVLDLVGPKSAGDAQDRQRKGALHQHRRRCELPDPRRNGSRHTYTALGEGHRALACWRATASSPYMPSGTLLRSCSAASRDTTRISCGNAMRQNTSVAWLRTRSSYVGSSIRRMANFAVDVHQHVDARARLLSFSPPRTLARRLGLQEIALSGVARVLGLPDV